MNLYIILSQTCIHPSLHIDNQVLPTLRFTCLCTSVLVHIVRCIRSIQFHVVACAIIAYLHTYLTCIHAHTCIHRRIHTCIHAYMHACLIAYMDTYMHTCLNAYMHSYMHTYIQACTHTHLYKIHRHTQIYIYIYIYIYM